MADRKLRPLSAAMAICLAETIDHGGKLIRHVGGYWSWPDCPKLHHNGLPESSFGTSTVQGLIARDELEYVEWRDGKRGRFPIAASVKQSAEAA